MAGKTTMKGGVSSNTAPNKELLELLIEINEIFELPKENSFFLYECVDLAQCLGNESTPSNKYTIEMDRSFAFAIPNS